MTSCSKCRRSVSIVTQFTCRCGKTTCMSHRFEHDCSVDWRKEQQAKLAKENPSVVKDKIEKI